MVQSEFFDICRENFSMDEFRELELTMEAADNSKIEVVQKGLAILSNQITSFFKIKETREKILNKTIYNSNGDITKITTINDYTLPVLNLLLKSDKADIKSHANELMTFYNNIKGEKNNWMKCKSKANKKDIFDGIAAGNVYALYCTSVTAFINGVSLILARVYNEKAGTTTFRDDLITLIKKHNKLYKDGTMKKVFNYILKDEKDGKQATKEAIELAVFALLGLGLACLTVFLLIRIFVFYYYYTRMEISDYFEQQAQYLNIHKAEVKSNKNLTEAEKKSIIEAQKKWADRFMHLSDMIVVDDIKSARLVEKKVKENNKEINPTNIINVQNTGMDFF